MLQRMLGAEQIPYPTPILSSPAMVHTKGKESRS